MRIQIKDFFVFHFCPHTGFALKSMEALHGWSGSPSQVTTNHKMWINQCVNSKMSSDEAESMEQAEKSEHCLWIHVMTYGHLEMGWNTSLWKFLQVLFDHLTMLQQQADMGAHLGQSVLSQKAMSQILVLLENSCSREVTDRASSPHILLDLINLPFVLYTCRQLERIQ